MKIGDLIARKDMPAHQYRIVGESATWDAWTVKLEGPSQEGLLKEGLTFKDDDRWEVVKERKQGGKN